MNLKRIYIAAFAAAALLPMTVAGQTDPNQNMQTPGPQNTPSGADRPGAPNSPAATQQPTTLMRDSLGAPGQTGQQMLDKQFMQKAAAGGIAEVKMGELAVAKGGPEVKEFGQKMVDDHTAMNKDMGGVADESGVMLPKKMNKEDQAEYDKLNGLSGDTFDKEYIAFMAKAHREDLHDFRAEAAVAADPGLQAEVVKAGMVIRQHLMMVTKLASDKGVALPPRPQRPAGAPPAAQ